RGGPDVGVDDRLLMRGHGRNHVPVREPAGCPGPRHGGCDTAERAETLGGRYPGETFQGQQERDRRPAREALADPGVRVELVDRDGHGHTDEHDDGDEAPGDAVLPQLRVGLVFHWSSPSTWPTGCGREW